jgi:hypothetical protein
MLRHRLRAGEPLVTLRAVILVEWHS